MNPNYKFVRVVLGVTVGASLWAGCASDRRVEHEPAGASISHERAVALDRQSNLMIYHSDTHPEWRTGWNMAFPNPPYPNPRVDDLSIALDQPSGEAPESR
jgi:hypothetical protein